MATRMTITQIEKFDKANEEWTSYTERVCQCLLLEDITEEKKKVAMLITFMRSGPYKLLKDMIQPKKPEELKFVEIVNELNKHYKPKTLLIAQRFKFFKRDQYEGESVANYAAELKKLASICEFAANLIN